MAEMPDRVSIALMQSMKSPLSMSTDFNAIFDALPDPYLVLSADGEFTILAATDVQLLVTGGRREEVIGKRLFDLLPSGPGKPSSESIRKLRASFEKVIETGRQDVMPVQPYYVDEGTGKALVERYWHPLNAPLLGPDGEVRLIIHKIRDVTESVRRQRENDARMRLATQTADLGSWEYEPATDTFERSPFVDQIFGFAPNEAGHSGTAFAARLHPDDLENIKRQVLEVLRRPDLSGMRFDYRINRPDGTMRWAASRCDLMRNRRGKRMRLIGVTMDITDDREHEQALQAALAEREVWLRQKDLLFREVNHRVKNSLQLVTSILNLQANGTRDEAARAQLLSAGSRIAAIMGVHERLYHSESVTTVAMDQYLRRLCSDIAFSTIEEASVCSIEAELDALELPIELAVPIALIVNELVTNAVKHAYPGGYGPVRLELRKTGEREIRLLVADKGVGCNIDAARQGLGSRLIPGLAKQLNGELNSENLNPGYQVVLTVPHPR